MSDKTADVVIIGGGVIGVSSAYYLSKSGAGKVLVLEKDLLGSGSTGRCAGGIRRQFSTAVNVAFSKYSLDVYKNFEDKFGISCDFKKTGYLFLASSEKEESVFRGICRLLRANQVEVDYLSPQQIKSKWQFIKTDDLLGGLYTPNDGIAGPNEAVRGFYQGAKQLGARFKEQTEALDIIVENNRVRGVKTVDGIIYTDTVLNAAGPFAADVGKMAGAEIPVNLMRRQLYFTGSVDVLPEDFPLIVDFAHRWYVRREGESLLISGSCDDKSGASLATDFEGQCFAAEGALRRIPDLAHCNLCRGWAGLYTISPDNHALIGKWPEVEGFYVSVGFSGHGFMHAPAAGRAIAEIITNGESTSIKCSELTPERLKKGGLILEPLTAFQK